MTANCFRGNILPMATINKDKRALGVRVSVKLIKRLKRKALDGDVTLEAMLAPVLEKFASENEAVK